MSHFALRGSVGGDDVPFARRWLTNAIRLPLHARCARPAQALVRAVPGSSRQTYVFQPFFLWSPCSQTFTYIVYLVVLAADLKKSQMLSCSPRPPEHDWVGLVCLSTSLFSAELSKLRPRIQLLAVLRDLPNMDGSALSFFRVASSLRNIQN